MPSVAFCPVYNGVTLFNATGQVLSGGKINTYIAGTVTPQATYTTNAGNVLNANPIILNSAGQAPQEIWLVQGVQYKLVLTDASNNVLQTMDNIVGINDQVSNPPSEWLLQGTPTYLSATTFSEVGNQTAVFDTGRRVKSINTGGTIYSTVTASSYNGVANTTTVTVVNDSGVLDSGLSAVYSGITDPAHNSNSLIGSFVSTSTITTNTTLTASSIGGVVIINGAATATLPLSTTVNAGSVITFRGQNASAVVAAQGADVLVVNGQTSVAAGSFALPSIADWVAFMSNGAGSWIATSLNRGTSISYLTSVGTATYNTPFGVKWMKVRVQGGGGGGGGNGTASQTAGGGGGNSFFGAVTGNGGGGGAASSNAAAGSVAGAGGSASGGSLNIIGSTGGAGSLTANSPLVNVAGGIGGGSFMGQSAPGNWSANYSGSLYGGGGGGAPGNATVYAACGGGGGGYCEAIVTAPIATTYSYQVGGGGGGGAAGTSGNAGAAGAQGIVIVEASF